MSQCELMTSEIRRLVVNCCNRDIVPDADYDQTKMFPSKWFENYFSFLNDNKLQKHLGEAFYQARFIYKMMSVLRLPAYKSAGIVKFQIIQYASIYEAILDYILDKYFDTKNEFAKQEYSFVDGVVSRKAQITFDGKPLVLCRSSKIPQATKYVRIDKKADFAVTNGIISQAVRDRICALYDLRNNIHLLKAYNSDYIPKLRESREAFTLMKDFVNETKRFVEKT